MFVAEAFTGRRGVYVPIAKTVEGFERILNGEYDSVDEASFYMVGDISDVKK